MNLNNMTCMYSTDQQFKTIGREKGLVLKVDGTGLHGTHWKQGKFEGKQFKYVKATSESDNLLIHPSFSMLA